ncbi:MAG: polysaccharide export outer membrane protein [Gammaproteobacteria bacterium]
MKKLRRYTSRRYLRLLVLVGALGAASCGTNINTLNENALRERIAQQKVPPTVQHQPRAALATATVGTGVSLEYVLGPADVIAISIVNNVDLDAVQPIRPDGKIAFYPAGDIVAAGRTVEQLRREIIDKLQIKSSEPYRLGIQDVVSITVYEDAGLDIEQSVSPDGTLAVLSGPAISVDGKTLEQVRRLVAARIATVVQDPHVNVVVEQYNSQPLMLSNPIVNIIVQEYNSRRVAIIGAVETPGIVRLRTRGTVLSAVSEAGGLSVDADLSKSIIFREGEVLPVNMERLFKYGDITQNLTLEPHDTIFVASTRYNRLYVIGQVNNPGVISWEGSIRLIKAVAAAGGYTRDAEASQVLVIKDGLTQPTLHLVDASTITGDGAVENNIELDSGDVVFIPQTRLATAERYLDVALKVLRPILAAEGAIILGESATSILRSDGRTTGTSLDLTP